MTVSKVRGEYRFAGSAAPRTVGWLSAYLTGWDAAARPRLEVPGYPRGSVATVSQKSSIERTTLMNWSRSTGLVM